MERPNFRMLWRAIRYVGRYRDLAVLAYGSLFLATAAQLMVPQLLQAIIDTLVGGSSGAQLAGISQTISQLPAVHGNAVSALIVSMLAILTFAVIRAVFSFGQGYNAERISQYIAYDFRNDLYSKIQRLSFSYHDRNQ